MGVPFPTTTVGQSHLGAGLIPLTNPKFFGVGYVALFDLRKQDSSGELAKQVEYCRDQFEAGRENVMAFEHFELKGERAVTSITKAHRSPRHLLKALLRRIEYAPLLQ